MLFVLLCVAGAVCGYLLGGVNGAILLSKFLYHEDIRARGSGNPGFTNFKRVYGLRPATVAVMLIDLCKTAIPVLLFRILFAHFCGMGQFGAAFVGLFCMLGHAFPVWYRFRGGKAFLAGAATVWFVDWRMGLISMAIFLLLLFAFRLMSLASICAAVSCPILLLILGYSTPWVPVISALSALLVVVRHHANIRRLLSGTESRFSFGKKKDID